MFNFFKKQSETTVIWIPFENTFIPYSGSPKTNSINGIANDLGYNNEQFYVFRDFQNDSTIVEMIAFEFYTRNVLFVFTKKPVSKLKVTDVLNFSQSYIFAEIYDAAELQHTFDEAIENQSFSADFLSSKFGVKIEDNGIQFVPEINYILYFKDGFLCDYQRSDGLNEAANYFKTHASSRYNIIESHAKKYWGNDLVNIQQEINTQCDALYRLPDVTSNPFISLHELVDGWVNYFMLLVTHHNEPINKEIFLRVNHNRFIKSDEQENVYIVGKFTYNFNKNGDLKSFFKNT